ncbi:MAG TPA: glycosyltransferase family 4 protein [Chthoniobacter sp.]|nr:glycosyltransferase family 4 protein [Chthoniobacter sp.]
MANVVAIITGERGQREIVRPLAAVSINCAVLDWEDLQKHRNAHTRFLPEIWKIVRDNPDAVVFTDMSSVFLGLILLVAKMLGHPVYLRLRGDPFAETHDQLRFHWQQREWPQLLRAGVSWLLDRPLFAAVNRFVPVSDWIVQRLGIQQRASIVRIPVDLESFPPREHQESRTLRLLSVTNFNYPQKVAALGRFLDTCGAFLTANGITMTIAGAGIAWETFCARHAKHAQFPGFVSDVSRLYREHDAFVHFSDLDAFPYVVLEAQAAGLPVIVNPACGMLEQVQDGVNGFLLKPEDGDAIQSLLLRLRDSAELRAQLGAQARQSVRERYALTTIGAELRAILPSSSSASS